MTRSWLRAHSSRSLVHRLGVVIQGGVPVHGLAADRVGNGEADALDLGAGCFPAVEVEFAFDFQRGIEHALAGHDVAGGDLAGRAVGVEGHLVAGAQQGESELEAGLSGADDGDALQQRAPEGIIPSVSG